MRFTMSWKPCYNRNSQHNYSKNAVAVGVKNIVNCSVQKRFFVNNYSNYRYFQKKYFSKLFFQKNSVVM